MESKRERMMRELKARFETEPVMSELKKNHLVGELQIEYAVGKKAAMDALDAFISSGRVKITPVMNEYVCDMCDAHTTAMSDTSQPAVCGECHRRALRLTKQEEPKT